MIDENWDNGTFARRLRLLRQQTGKDIKSTAHAMGWSAANLSHFENGHRANPTLKVLRKVAAFYHVPPGILIDDDPEPDGK